MYKVLSFVVGVSFSFLCMLLMFSGFAKATLGSVDFIVDVPNTPVISVSLPGAVDLNIAPGLNNGFASTDLTVNVGTNNPTGYQLSMLTSSTTLETDDNDEMETLAASNEGYTENSFTVNRWGYKLSGDRYFAVPSVLAPEGWASSTAIGSQDYLVTFAAKIDNTQPSGTYETKLNFVAVANGIAGVTFDDAFEAYGKTKITLSNYGYKSHDEPGSYYKMQDMTSEICDMVDVPNAGNMVQGELVDIRDNTLYFVGKMKDGNCWMTQNLDLDLSSSTTYTHADTDLGWTTDDPTATWIPTNSTINATGGTISGWSNSTSSPYSVDVGLIWFDHSPNFYSQLTSISDLKAVAEGGQMWHEDYHNTAGNYYNWTAAVARNTAFSPDFENDKDEAENSICPAGWRLPTYSDESGRILRSENEYGRLGATMFDGTNNDFYVVRAGSINANGTTIDHAGSYGFWYTSTLTTTESRPATAKITTGVYELVVDDGIYGAYGRSVRCVARRNQEPFEMQDIAHWANELNEGDNIQATDTRDGKKYWVSRLADGNIWMTQNLDLDLNKNTVYTHNDTDLGWGSDQDTMAWRPTNSTVGANYSYWGTTWRTPYSWDYGNYYIVTPSSTSCNYLAETCEGVLTTNNPSAAQRHYHIGNFYNWSAAVAMNDTSGYTINTKENILENPQNSICPAGWRLPTVSNQDNTTSGSTNEFSRLYYTYGSNVNNISTSPAYFVYAGSLSGVGNLTDPVSTGTYWSSTVAGSAATYAAQKNAYVMRLSRNPDNLVDPATGIGVYVNPSGSYLRSIGRSIRCVSRW